MKTLEFYRKDIYGKRMFYLADQQQATRWNSLTGRKTITPAEMNVIGQLFGTNFVEVIEP